MKKNLKKYILNEWSMLLCIFIVSILGAIFDTPKIYERLDMIFFSVIGILIGNKIIKKDK